MSLEWEDVLVPPCTRELGHATAGNLVKFLIDSCKPEDPVAYMVYLAEDVVSHLEDRLPEDEPVTDDEIRLTLCGMMRKADATIGLSWQEMENALPASVKARELDT